jgi:hypothetical protein
MPCKNGMRVILVGTPSLLKVSLLALNIVTIALDHRTTDTDHCSTQKVTRTRRPTLNSPNFLAVDGGLIKSFLRIFDSQERLRAIIAMFTT